jgi:hypothetical protein
MASKKVSGSGNNSQQVKLTKAFEEIFLRSLKNEEDATFIATTFMAANDDLDFIKDFSSKKNVMLFINMLDQEYFEKFLDNETIHISKNSSNELSIDKLKIWAEKKTREELVCCRYYSILTRLITHNLVNILDEDIIQNREDDLYEGDDIDEEEDENEEDEDDMITIDEIGEDGKKPNKTDSSTQTEAQSETLLQYIIRYSHWYSIGHCDDSIELVETLMHYDKSHTLEMFIGTKKCLAEIAMKFYANERKLMKLELDTKESHIIELQNQLDGK